MDRHTGTKETGKASLASHLSFLYDAIECAASLMVRYFGNLSDIDDRVRNISWQTLNLTQNLTLTLILTLTVILTLILTLTLNPNHIHTYIYTAIYVRRVAEIVYGV